MAKTRRLNRLERGECSLPRLSKERQAELIDRVVKKALSGEQAVGAAAVSSRDVVRDLRHSHFGLRRVRVTRVG